MAHSSDNFSDNGDFVIENYQKLSDQHDKDDAIAQVPIFFNIKSVPSLRSRMKPYMVSIEGDPLNIAKIE
tara:strand:+ start:1410 stop:1619 length:210 start_codon:yes stop_codon:yes gene_type:complete